MKWSHSVVSDSLWLHGLLPTRLLCPWVFPGKNTGVDCHFLLQEIFLTQGLNPDLPHCRQTLYCLSHQGSPTALLQLSFIWQVKDSIPCRYNPSWFPLFMCFCLLPRAYPMQIGLAKKGVCLLHLKFSLRSVDFLLFCFSWLSLFFVF